MTDKKSHTTASIKISDVQEPFERIRGYMVKQLPGIEPTNAECLRFAVHYASDNLPEDERVVRK